MWPAITLGKAKAEKRVFGYFEAVFDVLYLCASLFIGIYLLSRASQPVQVLAGVMALVLAGGDAFHLVPRIMVIMTGDEHRLGKALGFGKLITSITMTVFYVLLWHIGIALLLPGGMGSWTAAIYLLAAVRVALCFFKQNKWYNPKPPVDWAVYRNLPFLLLGIAVAVLFYVHRQSMPGFHLLWLAVALSFAFYIPVVLWSNKNRKLGMLMLPKTCAYLWMLGMCVSALS